MSRVRVHNFGISLDGFGTGEGPSFEAPFGHAGTRLLPWFFPTAFFRGMFGDEGGSHGVDDAFAQRMSDGVGVEIMVAASSGHTKVPGLTRSGEAGGATTRPSTRR